MIGGAVPQNVNGQEGSFPRSIHQLLFKTLKKKVLGTWLAGCLTPQFLQTPIIDTSLFQLPLQVVVSKPRYGGLKVDDRGEPIQIDVLPAFWSSIRFSTRIE
jgi:hypothetical protein